MRVNQPKNQEQQVDYCYFLRQGLFLAFINKNISINFINQICFIQLLFSTILKLLFRQDQGVNLKFRNIFHPVLLFCNLAIQNNSEINFCIEIQMVRIIENYTLYEVIGEGAYGKVYRAVNKLDNKQYAVKVIEVKKFQSNKKLEECTVHQINILTNIEKNKHIITYYDMLKTQNNFYFVYEYCNGGTLQGMLKKQSMIEEKKALVILKQLLEAFQVLNKYNIMHRDLKPDNIFFHNGVLKVGDFGFCKSLQKAQMTKTMLGSPIYMAPQILNGQIYSNKADIWSIGVVLYQMLYGYCPFQSNSIPKLIQVLKQAELQFPPETPVTSETKNLLRKILTKDPSKRIEWMQLFQLQISNQGKLIQQSQKMFLDQDRNLLKTVRQINEVSDEGNNSYSGKNAYNSVPNSMGNVGGSIYSPRNATMINDSFNKIEQKTRSQPPGMKKVQGGIQQGETVPMRKFKTPDSGVSSANLKQKILKFHQQIVRGINISRSMGLNNQRATPVFANVLLRAISEKMKGFREQNFNSSVLSSQVKQFKQIFDQQIDQIQYQLAMMRNKVEQFGDWKKAVRAKMNDIKNIRIVYQVVMFLSGQQASSAVSQNEMRNIIRTKVG